MAVALAAGKPEARSTPAMVVTGVVTLVRLDWMLPSSARDQYAPSSPSRRSPA